MIALLCFFLTLFTSLFKSKSRLEAENAALRRQLIVLRRKVRGRVHLTSGDRLFLVLSLSETCALKYWWCSPPSGIWLTTDLFPRLGIAEKINVKVTPRGTGATGMVAAGSAGSPPIGPAHGDIA